MAQKFFRLTEDYRKGKIINHYKPKKKWQNYGNLDLKHAGNLNRHV